MFTFSHLCRPARDDKAMQYFKNMNIHFMIWMCQLGFQKKITIAAATRVRAVGLE